MKKPINTEPITITVRPPKWVGGSGPDCEFQARANGMKSASYIGAKTAAFGLALKWFFGGRTRSFAGEAERAAITVESRGKNRYLAFLET